MTLFWPDGPPGADQPNDLLGRSTPTREGPLGSHDRPGDEPPRAVRGQQGPATRRPPQPSPEARPRRRRLNPARRASWTWSCTLMTNHHAAADLDPAGDPATRQPRPILRPRPLGAERPLVRGSTWEGRIPGPGRASRSAAARRHLRPGLRHRDPLDPRRRHPGVRPRPRHPARRRPDQGPAGRRRLGERLRLRRPRPADPAPTRPSPPCCVGLPERTDPRRQDRD